MKRYHKDRCCSVVRGIKKDKYGRTITLMGKHAFEWKVVIEGIESIMIETYPNRTSARNRYNQLLLKFK